MAAANGNLLAFKVKVEETEEEFEEFSPVRVNVEEREEEEEKDEDMIEEEMEDNGSDGGEQIAVESDEKSHEKRIDSVDSTGKDKRQHYSASSAGKIFVGGIPRDTTEEEFFNHFAKYGEITDSVVMKDKYTQAPRGFGFITFADPSVIDTVLEDEHSIGGKMVEVKRTVPKGGGLKCKKIFVGGIPTSLTEDEFKQHFSSYGVVVEHEIMMDRSTGRSRGFGFISFESEESVEKIISEGRMHDLAGKQVEIKKAEPKKDEAGLDGRGSSSYGYGGYHGYIGGLPPMGNYPRGREAAVSGYGFYDRGHGFGGAAGYNGGYGGRAAGLFPGYARPMYGFGGGYGGGYIAGYGNDDFFGSDGGYAPAGGYGAIYGGYGSGRGYGNRYHPYGR